MSDLNVVLVCPFDLDRLSGTPVRGKTVARALAGMGSGAVVATGGVPSETLVEDAWQKRGGNARFSSLRFARRTLPILKRQRPDVLHVMTTGAVLAAALYKLRHPKVRIVFESHGLMRYEMATARAAARLYFSALDRLGVLVADAVIVMSHTQKDIMVRHKMGSEKKMRVLWGPVETTAIQPTDLPSEPPLRLGYLGNGSFWQGVETVYEAAAILGEREGLEVVLAGLEPPKDRPLPSNVSFMGRLPEDEGSPFLQSCHVLLSPRLGGPVTQTQYPHKLSYYLAAGRPVIASRVNDQPRILEMAACGRTFEPGDAASLAMAISEMSALDRSARIEMGLSARRFAEEHLSVPALKAALSEIYLGIDGRTA
jgi:glycosyltransferase involved in cell wall biosynthesis